MSETSWMNYKKMLVNNFTVPLVRCPWGCSEFYPRCNDEIPLDAVWTKFVDTTVCNYSKNVNCWNGFRDDLLQDPPNILENPKWPCCLSLVIYNYIPSFLSCRYHNLNDHFGYIHVPTNVTGLISLEGDNTVAPITIVPRTVRAFKNNPNSAI